VLSPRFGASSDDGVADQSALLAVAETELQPDPTFAAVGSSLPTELPDSPPETPPTSASDADLSLILADVAAAADGVDPDLVGAASVGIAADGLTGPAIAPFAVGLLPGTVRVTGTTLEFVDAPIGLGGDNTLIVTALGSTLLIEDTQNSLIAGAGTTAVSSNQVSVDLTGITRIALDGGTGNDEFLGGQGADIYAFQEGSGENVIHDFRLDQGDRLQLAQDLGYEVATHDDGWTAMLSFDDGGSLTIWGVGAEQLSQNEEDYIQIG